MVIKGVRNNSKQHVAVTKSGNAKFDVSLAVT